MTSLDSLGTIYLLDAEVDYEMIAAGFSAETVVHVEAKSGGDPVVVNQWNMIQTDGRTRHGKYQNSFTNQMAAPLSLQSELQTEDIDAMRAMPARPLLQSMNDRPCVEKILLLTFNSAAGC